LNGERVDLVSSNWSTGRLAPYVDVELELPPPMNDDIIPPLPLDYLYGGALIKALLEAL
jgi:hypothetical protein